MASLLLLFMICAVKYYEVHSEGVATQFDLDLAPRDEMTNLAVFGDAQHRGSDWYNTGSSSDSSSEFDSETEESSLSSTSEDDDSSSSTSDGSSLHTSEKKLQTRVYRVCTPCPHDMLKTHKNLGIKWICAGYQRARRTFKSECMMRYRNCQDGTMFVKTADHRCKSDAYHGRHWFYIYKT